MNELKKDYYILRVLNLYKAQLTKGVLILEGPVKMEHFIKLKNYMILFNIKVVDIIVE